MCNSKIKRSLFATIIITIKAWVKTYYIQLKCHLIFEISRSIHFLVVFHLLVRFCSIIFLKWFLKLINTRCNRQWWYYSIIKRSDRNFSFVFGFTYIFWKCPRHYENIDKQDISDEPRWMRTGAGDQEWPLRPLGCLRLRLSRWTVSYKEQDTSYHSSITFLFR